jgi:transcriptional regulator with PAS, ATPase and Fis domain
MKYKVGIVLDLHRGLGNKIADYIREVLVDVIEFELFYMDDMKSMNHCDIVLVMIKEKLLKVLPYISQPEKVLTIKRTLKAEDLNRLKQLPVSDILVVNDTEETTLDLVITLHKLGLNHINWVPFYDDHHYLTTTAITANEKQLVPENHKVIDIGFRPIDISTIIEIMTMLTLDPNNYYDALKSYQKKYIPLDHKTLDVLNKNQEMLKLHNVIKDNNKISGHISYYKFTDILTNAENMKHMIEKAKKLAKHDINVLIIGESGTGKELIAQGLHESSYRRELPFVGVNVTAIPNNLLESELFGYVSGAFTGAKSSGHKGLFEQCQGGTIFLDEIGDLPLELQGKLLRTLEEQCIRPIGSNNLIKINVRVVAATNKNLLDEIEMGRFREDLYYRLKASVLMIPPLRQREGDIELLMKYFIGETYVIEHDASTVLKSYPWKGNVRELKHACEYAKIMSEEKVITISDIPDDLFTTTSNLPYFNQEKMIWVLESIETLSKQQTSVGRQTILEHLDYKIGESELKQILKYAKEEGFILQGRGRKGSVLTKKGELFCPIKSN